MYVSDDNVNYGWRLYGYDINNYGDIGNHATDLSLSDVASDNGATGEYSFATGYNNVVTGQSSAVIGEDLICNGRWTFVSGYDNEVESDTSCVSGVGHSLYNNTICNACFGSYNSIAGNHCSVIGKNLSSSDDFQYVFGQWNDNKSNTILEVGYGVDEYNKANVYELYKNGTAALPQSTITDIASLGQKSIPTVEYLNSKYIQSVPADAGASRIINAVQISQTDYDNITNPDPDTLYIIV